MLELHMLDSRLIPWIYWYNEVFGIKIKKKSMWWPSYYSRSYPMIGHMWVEHIASMSWRKGLCDHSWLSSRHHLLKREEKIQGWSRYCSTHKATGCTKWDHVSLGIILWASIKWRFHIAHEGWRQVVIVIKLELCKFKRSISKILYVWSLPPIWR